MTAPPSPPSDWVGQVRATYDGLLDGEPPGEGTVEPSAVPVTVTVPSDRWAEAVTAAREQLGCLFFDWLSAVDELDDGFTLLCHVAGHRPGSLQHLLLRTRLARSDPRVATVTDVYAGASWHERETHEMFGIDFTGPGEGVVSAEPLLLPEEFEGHPLRKDFVLASRVARTWPGAKEPGEGSTPAAGRRRLRPPGAPTPQEWRSASQVEEES